MKRLLTLVAIFATVHASAQQVNPVPDYVFRNQMSVGRGTVTDTAAYFSIGPRYGANKGFMPPIVGDTATFSSGKRNGLLIFSVQKNKFLYWDSVRVQWSDMAGSSGSYITGSGITGYLPQFSASTTIDTSALFTIGNRLGIGSSTFAYTSTNTANLELNGTAGGILGFKRNDSARGYLWHTGDNMELANTVAGSISFNTNSATRGSISSAGVWRLHNLAGTGDRVVVASSNGTLSASTSVTGLVDTTTISTRAWRQKGLDSLAALEVSGSGTTNYIPKFTAGSTIGNSQIFDNGTNVGIGTASPLVKLDIVSSAGTVVRTKGGTGSAQGSAYYVQAAGSSNTLSAFGDRANIFGGTVDQIASIYTGSGIPLTFDVGNTERLRITSGGDVGISQPSLLWTATNRRLLELNGTSQSLIGLNVNSLKAGYIWQNGNDMTIATENAGYIQFGTNGASDRMRIFSTGRIGINTTTDAGYQLDINGTLRSVNGANFATTSGNVGIGTASPLYKMHVYNTSGESSLFLESGTTTQAALYLANANNAIYNDNSTTNNLKFFVNSATRMTINSAGELLINTTTDAGDYKLQVSGNALVTAGKLDITTNTAFGLSVSRSGTSVVGGQINNSNGILYYGAESSTGGGLFTGSSAYAAVIGSGAAYPLQFATNNVTRATLNTDGELLINTLSDQGAYNLQINGSMYNTGQVTRGTINTIGTGAQLSTDSTTNIPAISINQSLTGASGQSLISATTTWNTTGNPSLLEFNVTNTASGATANYLRISDGTNIFRVTKDAGLFTSAPSGGTARKWKFGSAATVSPTSPNRTIQIEVDGVVYYLHAKTTND